MPARLQPRMRRRERRAIISLAANARAYYANLFGPAPDVPTRLITVRRGAGFSDSGTILIEPGALRRAKVDSATALVIIRSDLSFVDWWANRR